MVAKIEIEYPNVTVKSIGRMVLCRGKGTFELRNPVSKDYSVENEYPGKSAIVLVHPDGRSETEIFTYENYTTVGTDFSSSSNSPMFDAGAELSNQQGKVASKNVLSIKGTILGKVTHIDPIAKNNP